MHEQRTERTFAHQAEQRGYTLLEALISATILLSMILVVTTLSQSGSEAERYAGRLTRATEVCQEVVDEMRRNLAASVRVFHDDAIGSGYVSRLEFAPGAPRITSRLPKLRSRGVFERESSGSLFTGNGLSFASHAWSDSYVTNSGRTYNLDVYRVYAYYLRLDGDGLVPGEATGLNLSRFVSEPLVDGKQVDAITDADDLIDVLSLLSSGRTSVAQATPVRPPLVVAWLLGEDPSVAGTLRQIDTTSFSLSLTPLAPRSSSWTLLRDVGRSSDGMLYLRHHSVATNWSQPAYGVGRFSVVSNSGQGFPHGFEVQVIGPSAARQVLLRLIVVSTNRAGHTAWSRTEVIQDCRDI